MLTKTQILKAYKQKTDWMDSSHGPITEDRAEIESWLDSHLSLFEKAIREETLKEVNERLARLSSEFYKPPSGGSGIKWVRQMDIDYLMEYLLNGELQNKKA